MANYNTSKRSSLHIYFIFVTICFVVFTISYRFQYHGQSSQDPLANGHATFRNQDQEHPIDHTLLSGHAIAPKLGNETAKAELGRAAWKLFHTTFARFPDKPTAEEKTALKTYVHLFQRLYPCGECAGHFGQILEKYPPQVSSRSAAAAWGCLVHNEVNKSLDKDLFDCLTIGDFYECGCAEEDGGEDIATKKGKPNQARYKSRVLGEDGRPLESEGDQ